MEGRCVATVADIEESSVLPTNLLARTRPAGMLTKHSAVEVFVAGMSRSLITALHLSI